MKMTNKQQPQLQQKATHVTKGTGLRRLISPRWPFYLARQLKICQLKICCLSLYMQKNTSFSALDVGLA